MKIRLNDNIEWVYPIEAITEFLSNDISFNFKTKSRIALEKKIYINLPGIPQDIDSDSKFSYSFCDIPIELKNIIEKTFFITPFKNSIDSPNDELVFYVKFNPLKPFKTNFLLQIHRNFGGCWK